MVTEVIDSLSALLLPVSMFRISEFGRPLDGNLSVMLQCHDFPSDTVELHVGSIVEWGVWMFPIE